MSFLRLNGLAGSRGKMILWHLANSYKCGNKSATNRFDSGCRDLINKLLNLPPNLFFGVFFFNILEEENETRKEKVSDNEGNFFSPFNSLINLEKFAEPCCLQPTVQNGSPEFFI